MPQAKGCGNTSRPASLYRVWSRNTPMNCMTICVHNGNRYKRSTMSCWPNQSSKLMSSFTLSHTRSSEKPSAIEDKRLGRCCSPFVWGSLCFISFVGHSRPALFFFLWTNPTNPFFPPILQLPLLLPLPLILRLRLYLLLPLPLPLRLLLFL